MSGISSGMTPRGLNPGLTPTNFAMDFGRGNRKEDGTAVDPSNGTYAVVLGLISFGIIVPNHLIIFPLQF